ncbi:MAG: EVE domain-containing protein [Planctomycetes bacterium]|nr:EVE domain-containing protein [Planctomycetota bacterium]
MASWLLKTEPGTFSYSDLMRDKHAVWDGVKNNTALIHMRAIRKDDRIWVYHTGAERRIVGLAKATSDSYPDPKAGDPKLVVFDLVPDRHFAKPIALDQIKADKRFKEFALLKISRLSVMPVPSEMERILLEWAGG